MISETVKEYVISCLHDLEEEFNIRILYAVETGSRGWGFANEDDYDIRDIINRKGATRNIKFSKKYF